MLTVGIETSCDETGVSLVDGFNVLSNEVSSSVHLHAEYGGVVPEIASRFQVEYILPVFEKALKNADKKIRDIELISVTSKPGLPGSLLVGLAFARALSLALKVPLVEVDHVKAHVISPFLNKLSLNEAKEKFPLLGVVISGGHTSIFHFNTINDVKEIARTLDDAAGEAFDKVSKIMGMGYPGGPIVEKKAGDYNGMGDLSFPRSMIGANKGLDFSFSGLKTAVLYYWNKSSKDDTEKSRVCFSFQNACLDIIEEKLSRAIVNTGLKRLSAGGGVINNNYLRSRMEKLCLAKGVELHLPDKIYCNDNGAMVGALGAMEYMWR